MEALQGARGPPAPSPVHIVVAMQVQDATGHLTGHALQGQRVGRHGLCHPTAPQVALEVPLPRRAAPSPAGGEWVPVQAHRQAPPSSAGPVGGPGILLTAQGCRCPEEPVSAPQGPALSRMTPQAADTFPTLTAPAPGSLAGQQGHIPHTDHWGPDARHLSAGGRQTGHRSSDAEPGRNPEPVARVSSGNSLTC